jgi:hypothetical protein
MAAESDGDGRAAMAAQTRLQGRVTERRQVRPRGREGRDDDDERGDEAAH